MLKWVALCAVGAMLSGVYGFGASAGGWIAFAQLFILLVMISASLGWLVGEAGNRARRAAPLKSVR